MMLVINNNINSNNNCNCNNNNNKNRKGKEIYIKKKAQKLLYSHAKKLHESLANFNVSFLDIHAVIGI